MRTAFPTGKRKRAQLLITGCDTFVTCRAPFSSDEFSHEFVKVHDLLECAPEVARLLPMPKSLAEGWAVRGHCRELPANLLDLSWCEQLLECRFAADFCECFSTFLDRPGAPWASRLLDIFKCAEIVHKQSMTRQLVLEAQAQLFFRFLYAAAASLGVRLASMPEQSRAAYKEAFVEMIMGSFETIVHVFERANDMTGYEPSTRGYKPSEWLAVNYPSQGPPDVRLLCYLVANAAVQSRQTPRDLLLETIWRNAGSRHRLQMVHKCISAFYNEAAYVDWRFRTLVRCAFVYTSVSGELLLSSTEVLRPHSWLTWKKLAEEKTCFRDKHLAKLCRKVMDCYVFPHRAEMPLYDRYLFDPDAFFGELALARTRLLCVWFVVQVRVRCRRAAYRVYAPDGAGCAKVAKHFAAYAKLQQMHTASAVDIDLILSP